MTGTFAGTFYNNHINTRDEIDAYVVKGNLHLVIFRAGEELRMNILKGDTIVDPITDEEVKIICVSTNGFYVETQTSKGIKRVLLPFKDTLLFNI